MYVFRDGPITIRNRAHADPQVIGAALEQIAFEHGGRLEPDDVVRKARERGDPLHPYFDWNDKTAAHQHRLDQARELIRIVRMVDPDDDKPPRRAFLSVSDAKGTSYRTATEVMGSRDLQLAVLRAAERDLRAFETRYRELLDICDLVRMARERLTHKRERVEARAS
jgi:hypothetical protein